MAAAAAAAAADQPAAAEAASHYRVVTRGVLRAGKAMDSAKVGELEVGDILTALERSLLVSDSGASGAAAAPPPVVRVRCEAGWTSEISGGGVRILQPMTAAEDAEQRQIETERRQQQQLQPEPVQETETEAEAVSASDGPGFSLGSSTAKIRLPAEMDELAQALAVAPHESRTKAQKRVIMAWMSSGCTWTEHRHPTALEREALLSCIGVREAPSGTILTREGEAPGATGAQHAVLFVVLVGELGLFMGNVPQKRIGPGMEIGEEALVMSDEDCVRPFTVKAIRPTIVVTVGPRREYMLAIAGATAAAAGFQDQDAAGKGSPGKSRFGRLFGR